MQLSSGLLLTLLALATITITPAMSAPSSEGLRWTSVAQDDGVHRTLVRRSSYNQHSYNRSFSRSHRGPTFSMESTSRQVPPFGTAQSKGAYEAYKTAKPYVLKAIGGSSVSNSQLNVQLLTLWAKRLDDDATGLINSIKGMRLIGDTESVFQASKMTMKILLRFPVYYEELTVIPKLPPRERNPDLITIKGSGVLNAKLAAYREDVYKKGVEAEIPEKFFDAEVFFNLPVVEQALIKVHVHANTAVLVKSLDHLLFDSSRQHALLTHFNTLRLASSESAKKIFTAYNKVWNEEIYDHMRYLSEYAKLSAEDQQSHKNFVIMKTRLFSEALETCLTKSWSNLYERLDALITEAISIADDIRGSIGPN
ncbi:MAG: hypothetical protein DHS80DRAFT_29375 [Piptocephalis tieghemiana]|nr:MAG: hypothetical protein DHS80DRAFT_29375 [Piptocephalis tieghemiana]